MFSIGKLRVKESQRKVSQAQPVPADQNKYNPHIRENNTKNEIRELDRNDAGYKPMERESPTSNVISLKSQDMSKLALHGSFLNGMETHEVLNIYMY
jgi:hypothetical protein